jgi:hypothetical protein
MMRVVLLAATLASVVGCAASAPAPARTAPEPPPARGSSAADTTSQIPVGRGTLRQDDVGIHLHLPTVRARLIPLDEAVLRVLAADAYATLRAILDSKTAEIDRLRRVHALRERRVWLVQFFGLTTDSRFDANDVTISASGREYRPLETIPVTPGFGQQRVGPSQTQTALYLFDDGLDPLHPLTVTMGAVRNQAWREILERIDRERALIKARGR